MSRKIRTYVHTYAVEARNGVEGCLVLNIIYIYMLYIYIYIFSIGAPVAGGRVPDMLRPRTIFRRESGGAYSSIYIYIYIDR
jgi:hypothetical protein